jgi:hypothetical protein
MFVDLFHRCLRHRPRPVRLHPLPHLHFAFAETYSISSPVYRSCSSYARTVSYSRRGEHALSIISTHTQTRTTSTYIRRQHRIPVCLPPYSGAAHVCVFSKRHEGSGRDAWFSKGTPSLPSTLRRTLPHVSARLTCRGVPPFPLFSSPTQTAARPATKQ